MGDRIGIIGYGRFGRALGELFREAGLQVGAWDTGGVEGVTEWTAAALAAASDVLVLAVPVGAMRRALVGLRPELGSRHLVLDVGSVKTLPVRWMSEVLGSEVPFAGTHPLFGPTSLALGERPLRVVICPSELHPGAVTRARELYERIGCEVVEQDATAHDEAMAETHALAYFIAKGMIDAGVRLDAANAPPSSQAILRTVEAVRSDAGHLFAALHLDNPFAAEVRHRLLEALAEIDRTLREAPPEADEDDTGPFAIPDLGDRSPEIRTVRDMIDDIDRDIVALLARRTVLARRAALAKAGLGVGIRDPGRESALLDERRAWAEAAGLDPDTVEALFQAVLRYSRRVQEEGRGLRSER